MCNFVPQEENNNLRTEQKHVLRTKRNETYQDLIESAVTRLGYASVSYQRVLITVYFELGVRDY